MDAATRKLNRRVPPEYRQRTEHSCDRCKSRKQKCHRVPGEDRCRHCERYNYACTTNKPRKQRIYGSVDLVRSRIEALERLVKMFLPDADLSSIESMQEIERSLTSRVPEMEAGKYKSPQPEPSQESDSTKQGHGSPRVENEELVQDQQGQDQYIGPASSYFFQMKLRTLLGRDRQHPRCQMYLFGRNPTEETLRPSASQVLSEYEIREVARPPQTVLGANVASYPVHYLDPFVIEGLIRAYFDYVNVDFPVLHEATFMETFYRWRASPISVDRSWVCGLLCVLILSRRAIPLGTTETQQQKWWTHVEALLPSVLFTSNIHSIQALMLAALHLHNTNHRDACWTLTGVAARIAVAIGLHRDEIIYEGPRLARELRKSLWWTLYSFEQIQVSSHDRPSAIESTLCTTTIPNEKGLGIAASNWPPEYMLWSTRLASMLGLVCHALPTFNGETSPSPVAALLEDLTQWHASLPHHLSLSAFNTLPDPFKRPVLLLHIQYHYTVSLLTRHALLQHLATISQKSARDPKQSEIEAMAQICCESGRKSCELLLHLDLIGKFNSVTWWDVYYVYSAALVLTLSILCDLARQHSEESASNGSISLLHNCATILNRHSGNPMVPDTMIRWIGAICDINMLVHERLSPSQQTLRMYQSGSIPEAGPANTLVQFGSSMGYVSTSYPGIGVELDPNTQQSFFQMGSAMGFSSGNQNIPEMGIPILSDNNDFFSWDSIGCMLLGVETLYNSFGQ